MSAFLPKLLGFHEGQGLTKFFIGVQIVQAGPRVLPSASGDEAACLVVDGHAGDLVLEVDLFEQAARGRAVEEIYTPPCGHAKNARIGRPRGQAVEFAAADGAVDGVFDDRMS